MKMKHLIGLGIIMIVFVSCEGGTTYTKNIDNQTSETITVTLITLYGSNDPVTILPKTTKEIYWDDQMGSFADESFTCTELIDSIKITITNNKSLTKDILNPDNWIRKSKSDSRNYREDCTFIITENDIQ
jgi:hypothetical protein